ncbi:hypothetical protein P3T76_005465 [Phytophthora citrophthora]|uniref:Uncharacterized protein n=1 Tax=Phytophthora citrophthora TaxID=4793 RepID=A0AAD9GRD0_9STRA|nr:hypothetical protein P3T76_005465 [Phytophthora citrophthora]
MRYTITAMGYASVRGHTCRDNLIAATTIQDVEDEMKAAAGHLAVEHRDWRAWDVWEKLRKQFYDDEIPDVDVACPRTKSLVV